MHYTNSAAAEPADPNNGFKKENQLQDMLMKQAQDNEQLK